MRLFEFQSTLPVRGATTTAAREEGSDPYFNPRSPYGERPGGAAGAVPSMLISIHAPRTGSDDNDGPQAFVAKISIHAPRTGSDPPCLDFADLLSISIHAPRTGSDGFSQDRKLKRSISIHAPRTGSDFFPLHKPLVRVYFNPRSPYGERRRFPMISYRSLIFQSTLPVRGATTAYSLVCTAKEFQSTLPVRGATTLAQALPYLRVFQSTLPVRGATPRAPRTPRWSPISIHAPRTGSDPGTGRQFSDDYYFNPRSPYGERPASRHL